MHQTIIKIKSMKEERKEEIEYLLHERALLMKEYFRIQRNFFTSLKPKILTKKKFLKQKPPERL